MAMGVVVGVGLVLEDEEDDHPRSLYLYSAMDSLSFTFSSRERKKIRREFGTFSYFLPTE
jgi:hypothetical protein